MAGVSGKQLPANPEQLLDSTEQKAIRYGFQALDYLDRLGALWLP